jgi:hypothetical protein
MPKENWIKVEKRVYKLPDPFPEPEQKEEEPYDPEIHGW